MYLIRLGWLERKLDTLALALLNPRDGRSVDFSRPRLEEALVPPDSASWRIFKNPLSLFIGGLAAVLLELADPAVRTGVWEHSSFRQDPLGRLRRTGLAAMITVYGPRSVALPMIARVSRLHAAVNGVTPAGLMFCAADADLLKWVHATASYGFVEAYSRYAQALSAAEMDAFYREGRAAAHLYGVSEAPQSRLDVRRVFEAMRGRLEASPIIFDFLKILADRPAVPAPFAWMQPLLTRAAVELLPDWVRLRLRLDGSYGLRACEAPLVKWAVAVADRVVLPASPPAQSCLRLGLPLTYLY